MPRRANRPRQPDPSSSSGPSRSVSVKAPPQTDFLQPCMDWIADRMTIPMLLPHDPVPVRFPKWLSRPQGMPLDSERVNEYLATPNKFKGHAIWRSLRAALPISLHTTVTIGPPCRWPAGSADRRGPDGRSRHLGRARAEGTEEGRARQQGHAHRVPRWRRVHRPIRDGQEPRIRDARESKPLAVGAPPCMRPVPRPG